MKKFLLQFLFLLLVLPGISQTIVYVNGYVTDSATGYAIPNHGVTIVSDSSGGFVYYNTVYTNANGWYSDTIPAGVPTGSLYIYTYDCAQVLHSETVNFDPANLTFTVNFSICSSNAPCQAGFYSMSYGNRLFQFIDTSTGNPTDWFWTFGDGESSTAQNPTHQYAANGLYNIILIINNPSTGCQSVYLDSLLVNDSTGGGCQAYFYSFPDSSNNPPNTYHFIDQSSGNIGQWTWNFGDGTIQTITYPANPNVIHTYAQPGVYSVCLFIQGNDSTCYDYFCDTLVAGGSGGCQADFTYYGAGINAVQFLNYSTGTNGPWNWSFGDGATSAEKDPWHAYPSPGAYQATLTIGTPGTNCYDSKSLIVYVNDSTGGGCQASFAILPDSMNVPPYSYQFIDQSSGNIVAWSWSFGDGTGSSQQSPQHTYNQPGTYDVCLTVYGADSTCYDIACETLVINALPCQASFTYSVDPASGTTSVQFMDQSTGNPTQWYWNFGDSTTSTEQNPLHVYPFPGTYEACLTIVANNCTSTFCQEVFITDTITYHQVYGQVFEGNFPLQNGFVVIFSIDSINYQPFVDVCPIDSNGVYYFSLVPYGNFLVYAIPMEYNGYLPTYYGDVLNWTEATVISLGEPNNPYDIHLQQATNMQGGEGTVSGQINITGLKSTYFDKMVMLLMNESGQVIYFDHVTTSGTFDFSNMGYGTYYLHAEMAGITSDNVKVVLSVGQPHADVVMTFSGNHVLGIEEEKLISDAVTIYPNPVRDLMNIKLNLAEETLLNIEINDLRGLTVVKTERVFGPGNQVLTIPVNRLSAGFYTISVITEDGIRIVRKIMISR